MPEWYLIIFWLAVLSSLGLLWRPLLLAAPILLAAVGVSLVQAVNGAARASFATKPRSRLRRVGMHGLTAVLYLLQPLARLSGRLRHGLSPWRFHVRLSPLVPRPQRFRFWSERWRAPAEILRTVENVLRAQGAVVNRGGEFDRWDLHLRTGLFGGVRLLMGVEDHGAGKQVIRFRVWPWCSPCGIAAGSLLSVLGAVAAWGGVPVVGVLLGIMGLWPLARTILECGVAMSAFVRSLRRLWPAGECVEARASTLVPGEVGKEYA